MARIGIDARFYGPLGKGLGRYTQEIVDNIINHIDQENSYVIFLSADNFNYLEISSEIKARVTKVVSPYRWYGWKEQVFFPFFLYRYKLDLMHFCHFNVPYLYRRKFILTIHDLILTKFPTLRATTLSPFLYRFKNWAYKIVISSAIKRAKKVISVSEFTKNDIISQFKVEASKISVTYEGVANLSKGNDHLFSVKEASDSLTQKINLEKRYFLYVGNAYPHKNLEWLVGVFSDFNKKYPESFLFLVGKEDYFYQRLKKYVQEKALSDKIIFLGYVPDRDLDFLFRKAVAYVFPSLYEGFGLPPLEAMSRACPVLSSNQSCLPEILGEAAQYFNPQKKEELLGLMDKIWQNDNLRQSLIIEGLKRVKKYSWWECAAATHRLYLEVLYG